jgi:hypothetical protein
MSLFLMSLGNVPERIWSRKIAPLQVSGDPCLLPTTINYGIYTHVHHTANSGKFIYCAFKDTPLSFRCFLYRCKHGREKISSCAAIPFGTELEAAQHWPKDRSILCHFAFRYGKIMSLFTVVIAMHGWGSRTHLSQQLPFLNYLNRVCRIVFLLLSRRRCRSFSLTTL